MNDGPVYSTEHGRMCPACSRPISKCTCRSKSPTVPNDGIVRVMRETKGRKGKGVTVITGIPLDDAAIKDLARQLKAKCGAGGTVKPGSIEIQGDHRDLLIDELKGRGWTVRRAGG